ELGAWSLELGAWSLELGAWSLELGAWSLELGAWLADDSPRAKLRMYPPRLGLLRRFRGRLNGLGAFLYEFDDVIDHLVIGHLVALLAGHIDHAMPRAAAGEADVGHQRFTRPVHHAADDRKRDRRLDVLQPLLQPLDRLDD